MNSLRPANQQQTEKCPTFQYTRERERATTSDDDVVFSQPRTIEQQSGGLGKRKNTFFMCVFFFFSALTRSFLAFTIRFSSLPRRRQHTTHNPPTNMRRRPSAGLELRRFTTLKWSRLCRLLCSEWTLSLRAECFHQLGCFLLVFWRFSVIWCCRWRRYVGFLRVRINENVYNILGAANMRRFVIFYNFKDFPFNF